MEPYQRAMEKGVAFDISCQDNHLIFKICGVLDQYEVEEIPKLPAELLESMRDIDQGL